jgi:hypothetical protein
VPPQLTVPTTYCLLPVAYYSTRLANVQVDAVEPALVPPQLAVPLVEVSNQT